MRLREVALLSSTRPPDRQFWPLSPFFARAIPARLWSRGWQKHEMSLPPLISRRGRDVIFPSFEIQETNMPSGVFTGGH